MSAYGPSNRECKLFWISFLQLRGLSRKLQSILGIWYLH